jgi:hypothetical protein
VNVMLVNAWRAAHPGIPNANEWVGLEMRTMAWEPRIAPITGEDSFEVVARLAVQESWRHTVLIYIYMVSCPRILKSRSFDKERIVDHVGHVWCPVPRYSSSIIGPANHSIDRTCILGPDRHSLYYSLRSCAFIT